MTNTQPPRNDDATPDEATDAPVFDDVAADHPEVEDAAPDLIETAPAEPEPSEPAPLVEPQPAEAAPPVEPAEIAQRTSAAIPVQEAPAEDFHETDGYEEHIAEPTVVQPPPVPTPPVQTVYVSAPVPPKRKGNRGFGVLFAVLGTLAFAVLFLAVMALVLNGIFPGDVVDRLTGFLTSTAFIVPLVIFFIAFVLLVLIVNRASWWAYVLGSFLVALAVYFGSIGVVLLTANVFGMTPEEATNGFWSLATSPSIIVAGILAREVTIWFVAAIASRGRKVAARNFEARAAYERELDNQPLGFS